MPVSPIGAPGGAGDGGMIRADIASFIGRSTNRLMSAASSSRWARSDSLGLAPEARRAICPSFCVAIARTATFHSKLTIMDEPTAALGVQETAQVENIIRTLKQQGEPLILISHNMRQVMDLCDRIVVWRRGRICANLRKEETDGQNVVAYITGAKTQPQYEVAA